MYINILGIECESDISMYLNSRVTKLQEKQAIIGQVIIVTDKYVHLNSLASRDNLSALFINCIEK